jgi:transposase
MRKGIVVEVSANDRARLAAVVADRTSLQKHVWRARIVLLTADGHGTAEIMRRSGTSKPTVWHWQERFMAEGVAGLLRDKTRKPGTLPLPAATVERVVKLTQQPPPGETTHWTGRMMAATVGISLRAVQRIWAAHQLVPHRIRTFKLSKDPKFAEKVQDIVGLYIDPPMHAVVLSVDEKSQIQALDRTQPGLPIKPGRLGTMTHDYKRPVSCADIPPGDRAKPDGTTTLFAALNTLDGAVSCADIPPGDRAAGPMVIGRCMQRHRHQEFIRFLNTIEAAVPAGKPVHLILDTDAAQPIRATHKHPKVRAWQERHPRFTFHFTPTSASWLNAVEGFFAKLTKRRLQRGVFASVIELQAAINRFLAEANQQPKPFVWTADPDKIIEKVRRGKETLASVH